MTQEDYLKQNLAGFENDSFAKEKMKQIITDNNIQMVIETGTYLGSTTKHFAEWVKQVYTIEVLEKHYDLANKALRDTPNVTQYLGNSPEVLNKLFSEDIFEEFDEPLFIFLDAHWGDYNPLLDELDTIAKWKWNLTPIIAIHDFKVPDHPELGFDSYKGQDYEWEWIKEKIIQIYGEGGFRIEYNSEATGAMRGLIYIFPDNTEIMTKGDLADDSVKAGSGNI